MSSAAYLRQYYQVRATQDIKYQPHETANYNQTVKLISEMIAIIKRLLEKIAKIKGTFQTEELSEDIHASDQAIQELKQIQITIQSRFTSLNELDQKMAGPFTFRLCKEMNYWRFVLPFVLNLITDLESKFEEQKKTELFSIDCIFNFAVNKINKSANQLIKILKSRKIQKQKEKQKLEEEQKKDETKKDKENVQDIDRYITELKRSQKERKSAELIEQYHLKEKVKEKALIKKRILVLEMDSYIYKLYKGLDIKSMEPIDQFCCDLTDQQNTDIFVREQKIRNRRVRKDIKSYINCYCKFVKKTISRLSVRPTILMRRDSSKVAYQKNKTKSSQARNRQVTFTKSSEPSKNLKNTNVSQFSRKDKLNYVDNSRMGRSLTTSNNSQSLKGQEKKQASKRKASKPKRRQLVEISNKKPLKIMR